MYEASNMEPRMNGEVQEVKSRVALGVIGAIVGAAIGAVLWVIIYQIGYIAYIAGIAIIYCAYKGYVMLAKENDLKGIIIAIVISMIVLFAAHYFCWGLDIYREFSIDYEITFMDALLSVPSIAFHPDFIVSFIKDLAIGIVLIFVGSAPYFRQIKRENNRTLENL